MNEWLSKGYSVSAMTDQRTQTQQMQRQYWEEHFDQGKANENWFAMNKYNLINNYEKPMEVDQQYVYEEMGIPPTSKSKKKKNVGPDPRFKRIINSEYRCDAEMEAEKLNSLPRALGDQVNEDQTLNEKVLSFLKTPDASFFRPQNLKKINIENQSCNEALSDEVTKDTEPTNKYYEGCNISFSCENSNMKNFTESEKQKRRLTTNLKRSASDCTLNEKKPFVEENENEVSEKVRPYPSTTRVRKVHNWIKDYNCFPEKRRSVITVIGQTQTKPFSKILNEIKQRRKLAKELDKHALCQAIMQSEESQSDVKNLVAKVDFVLPDGKVIYSAEKVYLCKANKYTDASVYAQSSLDILDSVDQKKRRCKMMPERDSSFSQTGKKNKSKRSNKKIVLPVKESSESKGSVRTFYGLVSTMMLRLLFVMVCVGLCLSVYYCAAKGSQASFLGEIFKPKATPWYEKLMF